MRNLTADTANQHLVKAIAGLAKDFGYETIAEGVEDAETLAMLVDYGVDFAQGFHIGHRRQPPAPETVPAGDPICGYETGLSKLSTYIGICAMYWNPSRSRTGRDMRPA